MDKKSRSESKVHVTTQNALLPDHAFDSFLVIIRLLISLKQFFTTAIDVSQASFSRLFKPRQTRVMEQWLYLWGNKHKFLSFPWLICGTWGRNTGALGLLSLNLWFFFFHQSKLNVKRWKQEFIFTSTIIVFFPPANCLKLSAQDPQMECGVRESF